MENQSISKERYFAFPTLEIGQLAKTIEEILEKYDTKKNAYINIDNDLSDGSHVQISQADLSQLEQVCSFKNLSIRINFLYSELNIVYFGSTDDDFWIDIDASRARVIKDVFDILIQSLGLTEVQSSISVLLNKIPPGLGVPELRRRVENLEKAVFGPDSRIQCFLSYRFSDENEAVVQKVKSS